STCPPTSPPSAPAARSAIPRPGERCARRARACPTDGWASTSGRAPPPSSPTSSARPAPSSGTGRWVSSRTRASRPAPAPSPRRSPSAGVSPSSAGATPPLRSPSSASRARSTTSPPVGERPSSCSSRATSPVSTRCEEHRMPEARRPRISGNWKMHHNPFEAIQTVQKLSYALTKDDYEAVDVSVHPPFTDLRSVQTVLEADNIPILLGAQHCHWEDKGAFTGEISPSMLAKLNVKLVIVGHSERRELFGEQDVHVNRKLRAILAAGMTPILCCGETLEEREAGTTEAKVTGQVLAGLDGCSAEQVASLVIAYEPIW